MKPVWAGHFREAAWVTAPVAHQRATSTLPQNRDSTLRFAWARQRYKFMPLRRSLPISEISQAVGRTKNVHETA